MATSKKTTAPVEETVDTTEEVQFTEGITTDEILPTEDPQLDVVIENTTATTTITDGNTAVTKLSLLDETGALTTRSWHQ